MNATRGREIVLVDCPDEVGLIHRITGVLQARRLNIESNHEFVDASAGHFFFRAEVTPAGEPVTADHLQADLAAGLSREAHEATLLEAIAGYAPDYLVLARYMRVLSAAVIAHYPDRIINIHHSFLPAFAGASPYRQAFARGVKLIGATAHFVTEQLDEGPIIAQDVTPVDHTFTPERMAQAGRDVEKLVLARAVRLVLEERVFLNGPRTIVFE